MMQNKVAAAFARKGLTLRRGFELLDTSRSGEVAFEDFITGVLEMEGHFSPEQLRHLLALVDTNSNEQIDYHEFTAPSREDALLHEARILRRAVLRLLRP